MKRYKPYTHSRRHMTSVSYGVLSKVAPMKSALRGKTKSGARNSSGRITVRHQGGGVKRRFRVIDLKQSDKVNVEGKIEAIEYDPNRSAFIMRVLYKDGDRRYVLAPTEVEVGRKIIVAEEVPLEVGNRTKLSNIPVGYFVHNIEMQPGKGGQIVRSAGSQAQVLAHEGGYTNLKLPSGEVRKILSRNFASLGQVSNPEHNLIVVGKAGRKRLMGIRPTVRGSAMNPVDHPYGGGEGRTQRGTRRPKDKWSNITGGRKTRKAKRKSSSYIIQRRSSKRAKKR
ncbi:MAG: 50S ribosomal protein L2 [Parcubacteria group bacterium GW2011_GWB1_45_7]|uniref:Large ribosomal subunit protein uL2 n=1 Tax=Candidatus Colwellbacteria bacterium RIFCSPLOWO2_02_FULL_45_11 TaxID=1797692 RepID=A0A1G1ZAZ5_9BACT|nr:MAG: 50S ribosomal protein L2 [Parcubacteria group bacterium GW2011_GWB1_45_7]OGY58599.1 MAG: 50S ribosomal protein L2 [Candidatus Colwellbacteria bacterium RIFCSPHIGHO2_02_FULL_45_17]OGY61694.1 MAG: 50S ribosomal protein L2 [Candidatus Colwellbacteria bacterium RIFCSPLOWO2_02_FULL_45_11]